MSREIPEKSSPMANWSRNEDSHVTPDQRDTWIADSPVEQTNNEQLNLYLPIGHQRENRTPIDEPPIKDLSQPT